MEYILTYETNSKYFNIEFDLGLAFGSVVMGLVVLVDFISLAVECMGNMP